MVYWQELSLLYNLACAWCSLFSMLLVNLSKLLLMLSVLQADLGELLRSKISLIFKANSELLRVISFILSVSVVGL